MGYSGVGSGEEVHHFATEVGLFKKHGLDVEIVYISGGSTVVQAMIAGEVQFGRRSATEVVTFHLAGFRLKILAALINKFVYSFVTVSRISKPQDLKGKAVAVLYAPATLIEKRPDLIATFLKAYVEGIQQFKTNRQVAYNIIAKTSGIKERGDIEEYHKLLTTKFLLDYPLPTLAGMKPC